MTLGTEKIKLWRDEPQTMVRELFGVEPDPWQEDVLRNFPTKQRIAMKACKGPGKTCLLAWLVWNFLLTRPQPKIGCTSINGPNLEDNLWPELQKWRGKSPLLTKMFEWSRKRVYHKQYPETWFATARSWPQDADPQRQADTLAGLHADYCMYVLDEAGGIPRSVMASAEAALATGIETKLMIAGNPVMLEGPLYDACTKERDLWHVVEITGDPEDPKRSSRISMDWAKAQIKKYGRDNPFVMVNVLGKFPPSSITVLLGPEEVEAAMRRHLRVDQFNFAQKRLGIDVARFGDDPIIIFPRQGKASFWFEELRPDTSDRQYSFDVAARIARFKDKWGSEMEFIDSTGGYSAGIEDALARGSFTVLPINFSGKPIDPRYLNKRSEMWFEMAEWIKAGGCLPPDPGLVKELTTVQYTFHSNGKFQIEGKDQIKKRLGYSPNKADALALTFALPEMPSRMAALAEGVKEGRAVFEYDPLEEER